MEVLPTEDLLTDKTEVTAEVQEIPVTIKDAGLLSIPVQTTVDPVEVRPSIAGINLKNKTGSAGLGLLIFY